MIQIENLDFWYKKGKPVFQKLSLSLKAGHVYGLLGRNGSGKSTLLKAIAGLARPASGKCTVNGISSIDRPVSMLADLYFLPEEVYVPHLTPAQFLRHTASFYLRFSMADFYGHLRVLEVDPAEVMTNLSFGQQKKVMIAFGLATNSSLLILDEPTNGLDIPSKVQFRKLIASGLDERRCVIISTHQVRDLDSLIDTILILDDHHIVVNKSTDDLTERLLSSGRYGKMDLEMFFNAITSGDEQVRMLVEKGGGHA